MRVRCPNPWTARVSALSLLAGAASCAEDSDDEGRHSGQTGSPVYESPEPRQPDGGGSNGEGGPDLGDQAPEVVPQPPPQPGEAAVLGSLLLLPAGESLAIYDVSAPGQPLERGRIVLDGTPRLVSAGSLDRVVLSVQGRSRYAAESIPGETVPPTTRWLAEVDASDPSAPRVVASAELPSDVVAALPLEDGYVLIGGTLESRERRCGAGEIEIALGYGSRPVVSLSAARWVRQGDALVLDERRELGPGQWHVVADGSLAVRSSPLSGLDSSSSVTLEVVDLATLQTRRTFELGWQELGSPERLVVQHAEGVLLVAGGQNAIALDLQTGAVLESLSASGQPLWLEPLPGGELFATGHAARPLLRLSREGSAATLSFASLASGAPVGVLEPFGDGFVALGSSGAAQSPSLRIEAYSLSSEGELSLSASLDTAWPYRGAGSYAPGFGRPWQVDAGARRIAYSMAVDDVRQGRLGLVELIGGELVASAPVDTALVTPGARLVGDLALASAEGVLQAIHVQPGASGATLTAGDPIVVSPRRVRAELELGGWLWAVHREDTGETSLSVRASEFAQPSFVDLPHRAEILVPLSESYLAVLGLSASGQCDTLRELPEAFPECFGLGNGVSVLAADAAGGSVVESFSLGSFIEGRPSEGIEQSLDFSGYLELEPGRLALMATFREACNSVATCQALGVPAYTSQGSGGCSSSAEQCDTGIQQFTSGARLTTRLFELDATDPEAPRLEPSVRGGGRQRFVEPPGGDLGQLLLSPGADAGLWAYAVEENLYDEAGESLRDAAGHGLTRWHVQAIRYQAGTLELDPQVNVPGRVVALLDPEGSHLATLEPSYDDRGRQQMMLHRLAVSDGSAYLQDSLGVGEFVDAGRPSEGLLPVLRHPGDFCAAQGQYELLVVDLNRERLGLSAPLVLDGPPDYGWGFSSYDPAPEAPGQAYLFGGPAARGRLTVDLRTDPPSLVRYEAGPAVAGF